MNKLDRFILGPIIADGGAGTVYRAEEELPGNQRRLVALKVLPAIAPDDVKREERYFNEVRLLAQLSTHPNIVTIYSMGFTDRYPWIAMEWAEQTLGQKMGDNPTEPVVVLRMMLQMARGLAVMHGLNPPLVHQDLKPANVLIDMMGNCKITDFSMATVVGVQRTQNLATVKYAAPELLSAEFGRVGPATDLYALGHIAYELAIGARGHHREFSAVYEGNASKEPPPNKWMMWHASISTMPGRIDAVVKNFPAGLADIVAKLMAKPIADRTASANDLVRELLAVRAEVEGATPAGGQAYARPAAPASIAPPVTQDNGPIPLAPMESRVPVALPMMSAAAAGAKYWVRMRGRVTGPFDLTSLQKQVKQGAISRLHQVSPDQVNWKPAGDVEGLYGPTVV